MYGSLRECGCGTIRVSPGFSGTLYGSKAGLLGREGKRPGDRSSNAGVRTESIREEDTYPWEKHLVRSSRGTLAQGLEARWETRIVPEMC